MAIPFTDLQPFPGFGVYNCLPVFFFQSFLHIKAVNAACAAKIELTETRNETGGYVELGCSFESDRDVAVGYYRKKANAETFSRTIAIGGNTSNCMMTPLPDNIRCQCITNRNVSCTIFGLTDENEGEEWKCAIPCNGIGLFSNVVRISEIDKQTEIRKLQWNNCTTNGQPHNEQTSAVGDDRTKEATLSINFMYKCIPLMIAMLIVILIGIGAAFRNLRTNLMVECQRRQSEPEVNVSPVMKRLYLTLISRYKIWATVKGKSRPGTGAYTECIVQFSTETGDTVCSDTPEYTPQIYKPAIN